MSSSIDGGGEFAETLTKVCRAKQKISVNVEHLTRKRHFLILHHHVARLRCVDKVNMTLKRTMVNLLMYAKLLGLSIKEMSSGMSPV